MKGKTAVTEIDLEGTHVLLTKLEYDYFLKQEKILNALRAKSECVVINYEYEMYAEIYGNNEYTKKIKEMSKDLGVIIRALLYTIGKKRGAIYEFRKRFGLTRRIEDMIDQEAFKMKYP